MLLWVAPFRAVPEPGARKTSTMSENMGWGRRPIERAEKSQVQKQQDKDWDSSSVSTPSGGMACQGQSRSGSWLSLVDCSGGAPSPALLCGAPQSGKNTGFRAAWCHLVWVPAIYSSCLGTRYNASENQVLRRLWGVTALPILAPLPRRSESQLGNVMRSTPPGSHS